MTSPTGNAFRLYSPDPINRPSKIRIGDINMDGFADLLYVVQDLSSNNTYGSVVLAINEAGTVNANNAATNPAYSAYYLVLDDQTTSSSGDQPLSSLTAQFASFFDFDEVG